jgi:hypothetical protein
MPDPAISLELAMGGVLHSKLTPLSQNVRPLS